MLILKMRVNLEKSSAVVKTKVETFRPSARLSWSFCSKIVAGSVCSVIVKRQRRFTIFRVCAIDNERRLLFLCLAITLYLITSSALSVSVRAHFLALHADCEERNFVATADAATSLALEICLHHHVTSGILIPVSQTD